MNRSLELEQVRNILAKYAVDASPTTPDQLRSTIARDIAAWAPVLKALAIRLE